MKTTFVNCKDETRQRAERHLLGRKNDFGVFMNDMDGNEETGSFYDYGLSFDYVELDTFDDQEEDYFRYQFSWGGPSDELRIYEDGTLVYVFLDWFEGIGFDVTGEEWAEWIKQTFEETCMLDFEEKREETGYYETMILREYEDEDNEDEE
jgi:hypothetical protein